MATKKLKHEAELLKLALHAGMLYAEKTGAAKFDPTDSAGDKIEFVYKLLVHDGQIQPLAKDQLSEPNMKHNLAIWASKKLPEGHPLLAG